MPVSAEESRGRRRPYATRLPADQRREQILDAALRIVARRGLQHVNMEAVARESGVTKPVVYGVFANSDVLLQALVGREQGRAMRQIQNELPDEVDLADPIRATSIAIAGFLSAVRANGATWTLLLSPEKLPERARAQHDEALKLLIAQITALAEAGLRQRRSGPMDAELLARLIVVGLESAARLVLADPAAFDESRMVTFVTELVRSVYDG